MTPVEDRQARDAFLGLFFDADRRDWDGVAGALADEVFLDYSTSAGAEPRLLSRAAVIAGWLRFAPGFDATHHHVTVVRTRAIDDEIQIEANGIATHVLQVPDADPLWTVAGAYDARLRETDGTWTIHSLTFLRTWTAGNDRLYAMAVDRAGCRPEDRSEVASRLVGRVDGKKRQDPVESRRRRRRRRRRRGSHPTVRHPRALERRRI